MPKPHVVYDGPTKDLYNRLLREAIKEMTHQERMTLIQYIANLTAQELDALRHEEQQTA